MNKKLGPGVLFIIGIICLYLGGVMGGAIGAGFSVGGLMFFLASIAGAIQAIARRLSGKHRPSAPTTSDLDELIQNWTLSIVKAPLLVWTQNDLMSQSGNATRTSKEIYATAGMVYLAEHMVSQNVKDKAKVENFANKLINHVADSFSEQMLNDNATRADRAEFSNMVKKGYFYFWTRKEASENSPKGTTDMIIDKLHALDSSLSKNELETKLRDYLVGQRFSDFANIASHIVGNLNVDKKE